ncbi:GAF domain-containing sensor histidine kinase [Desulfohalovibrio reitneri]|uniref:GAF domain-containing sensor histidine kinase n=1 Tax=Desulfohalovibrio reitneri TaxID=1307759 RepID=UPI000691370B|nr:ATP-binding protein [Desulfohalovibrio reitneri]
MRDLVSRHPLTGCSTCSANVLLDIATSIVVGLESEKAVELTVDRLAGAFPAYRAAYSVVDEAGKLRPLYSSGPQGMPDLAGQDTDLSAAPDYLDALRNNAVVLIGDVENEPMVAPLRHATRKGGIRAMVDAPLYHSADKLGLLSLDSAEPASFAREEVRTLELAAELLALALRQQSLRRGLAEERKRSREVSTYLTALFENMQDGIFVYDNRGGLVDVNEAGCAMHGYTCEELLAMEPSDFIHPDSGNLFEEFRETVLRGEVFRDKGVGGRKDGGVFQADVRGGSMEVDGQTYLIATVRDITAQVRLERELERRNQELVRSNRELDEFAYVASHDLAEPLRKIAGFGDILLDETGLSGEGRQAVEIMHSAVDRMQGMLSSLLELSRVSTRRRVHQAVDSAGILAEALEDLSLTVEEAGAEIAVSPLPLVEADPDQLRRLFQNLVGNALKYRREDAPMRVKVSAGESDGRAVFTVSDTGLGFPQDRAERILLPFMRLHGSEKEGTGMGLAICRRIVQRHGGDLRAEGVEGEGAAFIFDLPLARG